MQLERESGSEKAIEIPPPRPKKKPLRPYPRKNGVSKLQLSSVGSSSVSEQENGSPVSVLSRLGSDTSGSSISNRPSPVSSDGGDPTGTSLIEQDNGCQSSTTSTEEQNSTSPPASKDEAHMVFSFTGLSFLLTAVKRTPACLKISRRLLSRRLTRTLKIKFFRKTLRQ